MPRKIKKLTKKDIIKELESYFGKDDECNELCYRSIKAHECPLNNDEFCECCTICGATWIFDSYEVVDK